MDFCQNISLSGGLPATYPPEQHLHCSLDNLLSGHSTMEEGDINMEWLSVFVEDCLSSSGNCMPPEPKPKPKPESTTCNAQGTNTSTQPEAKATHSTLKLVVPCKARSKRKRSPTCWLAESELILPKKCTSPYSSSFGQGEGSDGHGQGPKKCTSPYSSGFGQDEGIGGQGQGRKCTHCLSQRTPQWRAGPQGPKTLCNACGVRYKSGRLLPEYRPAKSPTFVSHKHSNSHKKVLEMRMSLLPSSSMNSSSSL